MASVLVLLAEGFEEIEAVSIIDVLRRGGVAVTSASLQSDQAVVGGKRHHDHGGQCPSVHRP